MPKPATLTPYSARELSEISDDLSKLKSMAAVARKRNEKRPSMLKRLELSGVEPYTETVVSLVPIGKETATL